MSDRERVKKQEFERAKYASKNLKTRDLLLVRQPDGTQADQNLLKLLCNKYEDEIL